VVLVAAHIGKERKPDLFLAKINRETLAEMIVPCE